ncbi:MAG: hypothetical protein H7296_15060 [Bacteroidia bacterium]|nr:hypothetical protein [Bacteroidia bacterium]
MFKLVKTKFALAVYKNILCCFMLLAIKFTPAFAQHTYIPYGSLSNHILDRLEIKSGELPGAFYHSTTKSYRRKAIAEYIDSFQVNKISLSDRDYFNMDYLMNDNFEWSKNETSASKRILLKHFYKRKAAMYNVQENDFNLVVNPVLYYQVSSDKWNGNNALINNRGIEIRGNITNRIGFYTQISDEILKPNSWVGDYFNRDTTLLYVNFYKNYSTYFGYFLSNAYVTASVNKYMDFQFGHFKNFIGDGFRTFILSDQHPEYLSLRLNTRIWKMNYTNIWSELRGFPPGGHWDRNFQQRHYMATHHLSLNVSKNFNIGLFETILFQRDSGYTNTGFDLNYLNPIIFYKSVENGLNSTDKAIIGINYKYNFLKHFSLYGQIVFSEFILKNLIEANGWWGNKWATQIGLKYIDAFGLNNFDLQGELNICRPFMYTSFNAQQTNSNFKQFMAHPLGANFYETVGIIRYQPSKRITLTCKLILAKYGNDTNGSNWGKDIRLSYYSKTSADYGNFIGQGVVTNLVFGELLATYMPKHNLFFDFRFGYRKTNSVLPVFNSNSSYFTLGIRLNITQRFYDF